MFSILDSLLLRSLPVEDASRLAIVGQTRVARTSWTNPIWEAIRDHPDLTQLFDGALAWSSARFNLAQGGKPSSLMASGQAGGSSTCWA